MFEELKPCPFCGGKAVLVVIEGVEVRCEDCGARTDRRVTYKTPTGVYGNKPVEKVIELWNRRV